MRPQIAGVIILVLAQITFGQESESNSLPWWPSQTGSADNSINVKTIQSASEDDVTQQDTLANQDTLLSADENEISDGVYDDLTTADADREAFFTLFNNLLWDADDSSDDADTASGRQYMYRRKGLLQRQMPVMVRRNDNIMSQSYRGFVDGCYDLACALGLRGMFSSLARMFS